MVADFEEFLESKGIEGVGLGPDWLIRCLFFADDLVMFARTRAQMQEILNALDEYCALNRLTVNASKTKVIAYREDRSTAVRPFRLGSSSIEIVEEYTYLGISFACAGGFAAHEKSLKKRVTAAAVPIADLICKLRGADLKVINTLFSSRVSSIALYGAEIWSLWSLRKMEQLQEQFYKNLFYLHASTPSYVLRHQFHLQHLSTVVCSRALRWANRVLSMSSVRWPRRCLERLCCVDMDQRGLNWVQRLQILTGISLTPQSELVNVTEWLSSVNAANAASDLARCRASSHCQMYAELVPTHISVRGTSFAEQRLSMQILLHNARFESLYWRGQSKRFTHETCPRCLSGRDSLAHVATTCPAFAVLRRDCWGLASPATLPELIRVKGLHELTRFIRSAWPFLTAPVPPPVPPTSRPV